VRSKADEVPASSGAKSGKIRKHSLKSKLGYSEETVPVIIDGGSPEGRSEFTVGGIRDTGRF